MKQVSLLPLFLAGGSAQFRYGVSRLKRRVLMVFFFAFHGREPAPQHFKLVFPLTDIGRGIVKLGVSQTPLLFGVRGLFFKRADAPRDPGGLLLLML